MMVPVSPTAKMGAPEVDRSDASVDRNPRSSCGRSSCDNRGGAIAPVAQITKSAGTIAPLSSSTSC